VYLVVATIKYAEQYIKIGMFLGKNNSLVQRSRTYGTRAESGTARDFLGTRHALLSQFFSSFARRPF